MKRLILAQPQGTVRDRLIAAAGAVGVGPTVVDDLEAALDAVTADEAECLVIGPDAVCDVAFDLAEHVSQVHGTSVVMVSSETDALLLRRALRAGVTDVVAAADPVDEISAAMNRAFAVAGRSRIAGGGTEVAEPACGRVVTVFSTKGGVGKTVIATNLAVTLASSTGKRVALIDLDLEFGDVGIMLGIRPQHTIYDAAQVIDRLDATMLDGLMERHPSGVRVLLAPTRPEDAEALPSGRVSQIIDLVRRDYDYVVIDTCPSFSEVMMAALDRTDDLLVVTMMDVASIKNTRISLQKLSQLGYDKGQIRLVLNRSDSKVLLAPAEVENAIGARICAHIPSDRVVPRSVNKGVPVVIEAPKTDVAKSMVNLAKQSVEVEKEAGNVA